MCKENESAVDEQIQKWAEEYKRLFCSLEGGVNLSANEQIPPDEMRRYVDNYKKWFDPEISSEEKNTNMVKLKKVQEGWRLNADLMDKMAKIIESQLA